MCASGYRFWRDVRWTLLLDRTTIVTNDTFVSNRNPERVKFVFETSGGAIYAKTTDGTGGPFMYPFNPASSVYVPELSIERVGQLIYEPWTFVLQTNASRYRIFELTTPANFQ